MEWVKALNKAINYIESHLTDDITCDDIAQNLYISSFHFQRTFSLMTDMTVGEYIRNRRLSLAGHELLSDGVKVIDVALKFSYETPESFAKAFQRFHGVSPSQVRKQGTELKSFNRLILKISLEGGSIMDYKIIQKEKFTVIAKTRMFTEENSKTEIPAFWDEYYENGLNKLVCGMMGICTQAEAGCKEWKYGIGCEYKYVMNKLEDFEVIEVPSYTWAIFKCVGKMPDAIQNMWKRIYSEWLPQSNYELISDYDIEFYTDGDNSHDDYISEIWIPIKVK